MSGVEELERPEADGSPETYLTQETEGRSGVIEDESRVEVPEMESLWKGSREGWFRRRSLCNENRGQEKKTSGLL